MSGEASYSASHVEELLKCPICLDRYNHPKHLPCQHTVCKSPCLTGLLANSPRLLQCPQCRKTHPVPVGGVNAFPDNIMVNNLLDLPRSRTVPSFKCSDCERTENLSLCRHCEKQVCAECRPQHLLSIRVNVQETVEKLRRKLPQLTQKVNECSQRQNGIKVCFQRLRHEIDKAFDDKIRAMNNRRQALLTEVEVLEQGRLHELQERREKYELETASAASFCDSAGNDLENIASATSLQNVKKQCEEILKGLDKQEAERSLTDVRFEHGGGELGNAIHNYGTIVSGVPSRNQQNGDDSRRRTWNQHSSTNSAPTPVPRTRAFEPNTSLLGIHDASTHWSSSSRHSPGSNTNSLFGPYPSNRRRTDSPTQASSPRQLEQTWPRQQEAFSGFISLENPNFRRRRSRAQVDNSSRSRRLSHPAPRHGAQTTTNTTPRPAPRPALQRQSTFTRDEDDDDDDIVTTANQRRAISFQISLDDPPPLPPRTPNSLEAQRPVNNYQQKRQVYKSIDTRRGQAWFKNCTGLAVAPDTDNIYVVDQQASKILIFDSNGRHIKSFAGQGTNQGELDKPFDAIFKGDSLYVTDAGNNRIQAFTADGGSIPFSVSYTFQQPQGIASDGNSLYVCDSGHGRICVLGERVTSFQHEQIPKPTHISVGRSRIVLSDPDVHAVFVFSMEGSFLRRFGQEGSAVGDLLRPMGVAIDFQGFILVANSSNHRIDVFRENGRFLCTFGDRGQGQGQLDKTQGISVTSNGRVAICDGNKVEIF